MKRIDTHTHPKISKHFAFRPESITRMVSMARGVGLDGIALTEHFHGRAYWDIHDHLTAAYPSAGGVFWADGLALIPGGEVNVQPRAHVILLGEVDELRRLDRAFARPLSDGYEPGLCELLDVSDDFRVARIGAHMFRPEKELGKFAAADLRRLDALEVNGKDFGTEAMLLAQARALGLPIVAGSDAHHWLQLGVRHTLVDTDAIRLDDVIGAIHRGQTDYGTLCGTALRVRTAKAMKRATKWLHRTTGGAARAHSAQSPFGPRPWRAERPYRTL